MRTSRALYISLLSVAKGFLATMTNKWHFLYRQSKCVLKHLSSDVRWNSHDEILHNILYLAGWVLMHINVNLERRAHYVKYARINNNSDLDGMSLASFENQKYGVSNSCTMSMAIVPFMILKWNIVVQR